MLAVCVVKYKQNASPHVVTHEVVIFYKSSRIILRFKCVNDSSYIRASSISSQVKGDFSFNINYLRMRGEYNDVIETLIYIQLVVSLVNSH